MSGDEVTVSGLVDVIAVFEDALRRHEGVINRLNVYPVPDGDTGTNMLRTVEAAGKAIEAAGAATAPADTIEAIRRGSLMGARGNSGVILSQILRGVAGSFGDRGSLGPADFAVALERASDAAYGAVLRPVEGTLLTVAREASGAARIVAAGGGTLQAVVTAARDAAQMSLDRTPELLPVLREAGVVDAGGAGLVQLFESFVSVIARSPMPAEITLPAEVTALIATAVPTDLSAVDTGAVGEFRYEVMFLLEAEDGSIERFKEQWASIGDSIVVVGSDGIFNCHIHTDEIGGAIDAAVAVGRPLGIRVTDLREQVGALEAAHEDVPSPPMESPLEAHRNPSVTAVVAVASGAGVDSILRSLGVAEIVGGGQSMNPSTAELLAAIGAAVSQEVVVLPNNPNVIPVAREAAKLAGRAVVVVPTRSVQAGIAALVAYDPAASADENATSMTEAIERVVAGEVTRAARDAPTAVGPVEAGTWIGVADDGVVAQGESCSAAADALVESLFSTDHELLTVIEGAGAPPGEVDAFLALVAARHPDLCVERHLGGQPIYPILLALE